MQLTKSCKNCGIVFAKKVTCSRNEWFTSTKFCSRKCCDESKVGVKMTGERLLQARETQRKVIQSETPEKRAARMKKIIDARGRNGVWKHARLGKTGELDPCWLGEDATYNSKHRWIQGHWKKTGVCENCGKITVPFGNRRFGTEWANVSQNYVRTRDDWKELCVPCHRKIDRKRPKLYKTLLCQAEAESSRIGG